MIKFIITGGTLDKRYNPLNGELEFSVTHLPALLQQGRCTLALNFQQLMLKDSLNINAADRIAITTACINSTEQRLIVTHGTDTMVNTAAQIAQATLTKTIILVGAMVPCTIQQSDALFNLGCAITAVQLLPIGVYIVMNGQIFNWDKVMKDTQAGEFKALNHA